MDRRSLAVVLSGALVCGGTLAAAQPPSAGSARGPRSSMSTPAAMDRLTLHDGRTLTGLISGEQPEHVELIEVRRPPGAPMYLLRRQVGREQIAALERADAAARRDLERQIDQFRNRQADVDRALADIDLVTTAHQGRTMWRYGHAAADALRIESTADELLTRRCVHRIEQIFTAYRELLPPTIEPARPLTLRVAGSPDDYEQVLARSGLRVRNPAVYVPAENLVVAGSDLNGLGRQLEAVSARHEQLRREHDRLRNQMPQALQQLAADLARQGLPESARKQTVETARRRFERDLSELSRSMRAVERENSQRFAQATQAMFRRLAHEAFHAYLENFVFPGPRYEVPRWLNEGLAQVFEDGQFESGTLRLDAPDRKRLEALQADLRGGRPLALAELLAAGPPQFMVLHDAPHADVDRVYLYAWGLAYDLTFRLDLLSQPALAQYCAAGGQPHAAVARFERLVGMPLGEFEQGWREEMLRLKPGE